MKLYSFHPGWFGAVMGTGIVGIAAFMNPGNTPALEAPMKGAGTAIAVLAYLLALGMAIPYLLRWIRHPGAAWADLLSPVVGPYYATFPGGLLVLGMAAAAIGPTVLPFGVVFGLVTALGVTGGLLAFVISVAFVCLLFVNSEVAVENAYGGWFVPPVVIAILPLVLMPLVTEMDPETARLLVVGSYSAWGTGFMLFLLVASLLFHRLVYHSLPSSSMAPSVWIGLSPIGLSSQDLIRMAQGGYQMWGEQAAAVSLLSGIGATALWGFGLWWLAAAALLSLRYLRREGLPYGIGWWAFTFPLGAYTVATLTLARFWGVDALEVTGGLLFVLLVVFWLTVAIRALGGVRTGDVWMR